MESDFSVTMNYIQWFCRYSKYCPLWCTI